MKFLQITALLPAQGGSNRNVTGELLWPAAIAPFEA
jgi:hypothetical protein